MNTMPASASDAMLAEEKSVIASAMRKRFDAGVECSQSTNKFVSSSE